MGSLSKYEQEQLSISMQGSREQLFIPEIRQL